MILLAAATNLKIHHQPGVIGAEVHVKAKPNEATNLGIEQLGCWRSHADIWRRVVEEDIETAIILEDDADWDVNVHEIFHELSVQMRKGKLRKTQASKHEMRNAPYGLDWDLLYIGTCWDIPNKENRPNHQTYDDRFGPNRSEQSGSFVAELEGWGLTVTDETRQRVIAPSWYPVCTIGYAVTRLGAQKLLYTVGGVKGIGSGVDLTMTDRIQKGYLNSYTVVPPLVTPWKTGSPRDSDIDDLKAKQEKENKELPSGSENLQNSARRAIERRLGTPEKKELVA
ncbi:hypothetical protein V501_01353 [Pseudogymnoascus sp. VKM F-4519 (FW-2642)]|nr:hypothetical protein V501_01353 [Pseudogymnoascus sp. VKM F-4519 (FW-2642)]